VDPSSLNDLTSRIAYLKSFLQFSPDDGKAIQSAKALVGPAVPAIVDAVYNHLLSFDITAKHFATQQPEENAPDSVANAVEDLHINHPNIKHRMDFLNAYLVKLVSNSDWSDTSPFWTYLDKVGQLHTGVAGFKYREKHPSIRVEYVHTAALLGWVEDIVLKAVLGAELDLATTTAVLRAFNKFFWIQNDLFARHYTTTDLETKAEPNPPFSKRLRFLTRNFRKI
jgi:hypothetical protein